MLAPGLEEHIKALSRGEFTKIGGKYQNYVKLRSHVQVEFLK